MITTLDWSMARILLIEDDADLLQLLSHALFRNGFEVHHAFNGKEGYDKILSLHPDLVVLDLMLPLLPGTDLIKMVTDNVMIRDIPIIVMTAYSDQADMLERSVKLQGAREYIKKPFHMKDMVSLIRRTLKQFPSKKEDLPQQVSKGVARLDPRFRTLWINDQNVATLSPKEAQVLTILLEAKGSVKRDQIIAKVWGDSGNDNILYKTIQRLRTHLGAQESKRIQTLPEGYEFIG